MNKINTKLIDSLFDDLNMSVKNKSKVEELREHIKKTGSKSDDVLSTDDFISYFMAIFNQIKPKPEIRHNLIYLWMLLDIQLRTYMLSDNIDDELKKSYIFCINNYIELYNGVFDNVENIVELTFKLNTIKPNIELLDELDKFNRIAKLIIKFSPKNFTEYIKSDFHGMMPFFVFHKELIGNEEKWLKNMIYYVTCCKAYEHHKVGVSNRKLIKILGLNENDEPNSLKKIRELLSDAKKMIESTENGTFPY